ncbi:MAG: RNA polymerase sigma factor region1.1 domain-containing protein, partial [Chloroflexales bacterium]
AEPELTPFSLEDLGLSPEEIALLSGDAAAPPAAAKDAAATGDTIVPGWSQGEEPELTPFSLEDLGLSPEEIASLGQLSSTSPTAQPDESIDSDMFDFDMTDTSTEPEAHTADMLGNEVEPFSFDDFDFDSGDATAASASPTIDESVANIKPFSFDDFGLGDVEPALPRDRGTRELSLTDDELAGLDLGEFESLIGGSGSAAPVSEPDVVTGDLALDRLIMLGQRQGFVDLTDIISVVDDPEAEAERIEEIGWTLHRAGIEIRDGDEVIDMEDSESEADEEDSEIAELASRADAGPTALATLSDAEPELTPFSLEELGLSPEEIAALGLSENSPQATFTPAPPAVAADAEPELTPFSLEELGLSPEEIALLSSAAEPAPAPAPVAPAPVTPAPVADAEPDLTPFSLEDLGLSPEEIAALSIVEEAPAASATGDDLFSFDVAEARPVEKAVRTAPRIEEPPPPPPTEDKGFTPEPLDSLDAIWDIPAPVAPAAAASAPAAPQPAREKSVSPARVVLPPLVERESTSRGERREPPPRARDDDRYARRTPPTRSHDDLYARREELAARTRDDRSGRRDTRSASPSRPAARQSFGSFVPTGDETLDEYLIQLDAETDNYGMALALARICAQTGRADLMAYTYKQLLRGSHALDAITEEVQELIDLVDDQAIEQQLYRVLGDALSKQGRLRDAMAAYNHTFGG